MGMATRRLPIAAWFVGATLLGAHLLTIGRYGVFRDELYYVANGRHLAWGYVDHPPLVAALAWLTEHTVGTSVPALRAPILLALVALLVVVAALVRRLGGGGAAVAVAWLALALGPYYLFAFHYLSMNAPEILWWSLAALLFLRATEPPAGARADTPAEAWPWLAFGALMGVAALTKVSGLVWGAGLAVGLLVTPARRHLRQPWPWVAVALAGLLFAPHVLWQARHGWPTAEFIRNAQATKIVALAPAAFLREQVGLIGPVGLIVALAGLVACGRGRVTAGRTWAAAFTLTLLVFLVQRSKPYYMAPAYPILFAAGGVAIERWRPWRSAIGKAAIALFVALGLMLAPLTLPILPPDRLPAYMARLGIEVSSDERHRLGALPQHFADMFGWETLADDVARVVTTLAPAERATARVYGQNYGEAGAIDYFGPARGLPPAISGHNAYWFWGPGPGAAGVLIIIGGKAESHRRAFDDVREAGRTTCTRCMPYERDLPIFVARGLRRPLADVWPAVRHFD